jgi:protease II
VTSDVRFISADAPAGDWQVVLPRENEVEYSVEDRGDHLFITIRQAAPGGCSCTELWSFGNLCE